MCFKLKWWHVYNCCSTIDMYILPYIFSKYNPIRGKKTNHALQKNAESVLNTVKNDGKYFDICETYQ